MPVRSILQFIDSFVAHDTAVIEISLSAIRCAA